MKGPSVLTYGSPVCWPAELAQLPGVLRDADRWSSLLIFGLQHAVHIDMQDREESPDEEMESEIQRILEDAVIQNWKTGTFTSFTFEMKTPGSLMPNG